MKILLISTNQEYFAHRITPIGLLYLASGLINKGHKVVVLDLMFSRKPLRQIQQKILEFNPEIVGLSLRNLDTMITKDKSLISYNLDCFNTVKKNTKALTIIGGPGFTIAPKELFEIFNADFGLIGEADYSFPLLVENIYDNKTLENFPGLVVKNQNKIIINPRQDYASLERIPKQTIELIDINKYKKKRGFVGILTKRSCTQQCVFCDEQALYGPRIRLRSAKAIVDEIEHIVKITQMRYFDFADPLFNSPRTHMLDVLHEIVKRDLKIKFKVELNPIGQDEEIVLLLKKAGCIGVDFSPDAGSEITLKSLNKGFSTESVYRVACLYAKYKMPYSVGFLVGGPGENLQSVKEAIQLAQKLPKANVVYFTVGLTIGGGNSILERSLSDQFETKSSDIIKINYYLSKDFNTSCANLLLDACRKNPRFYISDVFLSHQTRFFWKLSDLCNLRPVWKYGWFPSIALRLLHFGKYPIVWNDKERRFIIS